MTVLAWHLVTKDQDYAFARPGLVTHDAASSSSQPARRHGAGTAASPARPTTTKQRGNEEAAAAERAYEVLVAHWQPRIPPDTRSTA
jgi:transposase